MAIRLDSFRIEGGRALKGTVRISGSKNAALPCLFAALLTDEDCVLKNVPDLQDIRTALSLLTQLGKTVESKDGEVWIRAKGKINPHADYELVRRMRASVVVMGPLLARTGSAHVSLPGGCSIGARPINYHLAAFERLGATIEMKKGYITARAPQIKGARIRLPFPSVGATENVLMAASLGRGDTILTNAATEPEIGDLVRCLLSMGARIDGIDTPTLRIRGVAKLNGADHTVIPDRIEAGTFLIAAAITRGRVKLTHVNAGHLTEVIAQLKRAGLTVTEQKNQLEAVWRRPLKAVSVRTKVYPGFPTDMQAQWLALMTQSNGKCEITEAIFENRFLHAHEISRMGGRIEILGHKAICQGPAALFGCPVMVSDLRAGAALVLAGLCAKGTTDVLRVYHLDRGYESMEKKLRALGARIRRITRAGV